MVNYREFLYFCIDYTSLYGSFSIMGENRSFGQCAIQLLVSEKNLDQIGRVKVFMKK